jgi:hypothetical protein
MSEIADEIAAVVVVRSRRVAGIGGNREEQAAQPRYAQQSDVDEGFGQPELP